MGNLQDLFKKKLTPELFGQIEDALGDDFDWDFVPRTRLNKVIAERNELRKSVPAESDVDSEPETKPAAAPKGKVLTQADIDAAVQAAKDEAKADLEALKLQSAVTDKLRALGVRDPDLLIPKLDMKTVKFNEKKELTGLDEQVATWKTSKPYLFEEALGGTGVDGKGSNTPDLKTIEIQYTEALKAGRTAEAVSLKNQIFQASQKK